MKLKTLSSIFLTLAFAQAAHADTFTECSAECVAVGDGEAMDLGPVISAEPTDIQAYQDLIDNCQTITYNADPCAALFTQETSILAKSMDLVLTYARLNDPTVCKSNSATTIPQIPKPVKVPQPYCGGGSPLG